MNPSCQNSYSYSLQSPRQACLSQEKLGCVVYQIEQALSCSRGVKQHVIKSINCLVGEERYRYNIMLHVCYYIFLSLLLCFTGSLFVMTSFLDAEVQHEARSYRTNDHWGRSSCPADICFIFLEFLSALVLKLWVLPLWEWHKRCVKEQRRCGCMKYKAK